jgi:hypothetical protein
VDKTSDGTNFFQQSEIERSIPNGSADRGNYPWRTAIQRKWFDHLFRAEFLANRVAHAILAEIGRVEPIVLLFGHEPGIIPALLSVLKSGNAYSALILTSRRQEQFHNRRSARIIITNTATIPGKKVVWRSLPAAKCGSAGSEPHRITIRSKIHFPDFMEGVFIPQEPLVSQRALFEVIVVCCTGSGLSRMNTRSIRMTTSR